MILTKARAMAGLLVVGLAAFAGVSHAQEGMGDMAAMMKKMEAVTKKGKEHAELAKAVGKWDVTVRMYWGGPGMPPAVTKGTAEIESIHDGRFIKETITYDMLMPGPDGNMETKTIQGMSIMGYNNFRKLYEVIYCDNWNTNIIKMSGTSPPGSNKLFLYGEMDEPMMDMVGRHIKAVSTTVSDDKHLFEMYDLAAGEDHKAFEIEYVRRK
ncbi:MAG: DUF1579 family protein [Phycisphaerae bacterium]|nr:DUF1579 family protein [Phycisphaerae bacterium]